MFQNITSDQDPHQELHQEPHEESAQKVTSIEKTTKPKDPGRVVAEKKLAELNKKDVKKANQIKKKQGEHRGEKKA